MANLLDELKARKTQETRGVEQQKTSVGFSLLDE